MPARRYKSPELPSRMELFETAGNPVPPDGMVIPVRTFDRRVLRAVRWSAQDTRGTVTIAIGRSEFIEEYYEIARALLARRFDVIVFDWRGQGQSSREIRAVRRGHVSSFAAHRRDLASVETQVLRPYAPKPWYGLGHSMGAAILLDQAHDGTSPFERLVLSAPMIDIPLRWRRGIRRVVRAMDSLGLGARLIPGGSEQSIFTRRFDDNVLTTDLRQYQRLSSAMTQLPDLAVGAPTIRWLASAFDLMERFEDPRYAVETLTPILIVAAGDDRIVDTAATERFAIRLKAGQCITIPYARHQLIMEREAIVSQFWAAFDAFVPGEAVPAEAPAAKVKRSRSGGLLRRLVDYLDRGARQQVRAFR